MFTYLSAFLSGESETAEAKASIPTKFCLTTNISTSWIAQREQSLLFMITLFPLAFITAGRVGMGAAVNVLTCACLLAELPKF